jgi:hypothetical protein
VGELVKKIQMTSDATTESIVRPSWRESAKLSVSSTDTIDNAQSTPVLKPTALRLETATKDVDHTYEVFVSLIRTARRLRRRLLLTSLSTTAAVMSVFLRLPALQPIETPVTLLKLSLRSRVTSPGSVGMVILNDTATDTASYADGIRVGTEVGANEGTGDGKDVGNDVGTGLGSGEGNGVGELEGRGVGRLEGKGVGELEGRGLGRPEGNGDGSDDGIGEGSGVGSPEGNGVGDDVGSSVGTGDGT